MKDTFYTLKGLYRLKDKYIKLKKYEVAEKVDEVILSIQVFNRLYEETICTYSKGVIKILCLVSDKEYFVKYKNFYSTLEKSINNYKEYYYNDKDYYDQYEELMRDRGRELNCIYN